MILLEDPSGNYWRPDAFSGFQVSGAGSPEAWYIYGLLYAVLTDGLASSAVQISGSYASADDAQSALNGLMAELAGVSQTGGST
jgi:hypothetical protein